MNLGSFLLIKMVRNWCWNYYDADKTDPEKGICKFCAQSYGSGYVERMINHLKSSCKKIPPNARAKIEQYLKMDKTKGQQTIPAKNPTSSSSRASSVMNFMDSMDEDSQKLNDELLTRVYFLNNCRRLLLQIFRFQ